MMEQSLAVIATRYCCTCGGKRVAPSHKASPLNRATIFSEVRLTQWETVPVTIYNTHTSLHGILSPLTECGPQLDP